MPTIDNVNDLIAVANTIQPGANPVNELERRGFELEPTLRAAMVAAHTPAKLPNTTQRRRWTTTSAAIGPSKFTLAPVGRRLHSLDAGDYDVIAGIGLDLVDEALAGLYQTHVVPRAIALPELVSNTELRSFLTDVLRVVFEGIPEADDIEVGELHLSAPPTTSPVHRTNRIIVHQPFILDIDRVRRLLGKEQREQVTSIVGTLHVGVELRADVELDPAMPGSNFHLVMKITAPSDPTVATQLAVDIDPSSPITARPGMQLESLATVLGLVLRRELASAAPDWIVSPRIALPFGPESSLLIRQIDVRTVSTAAGGAAVVGARIGGPTPAPGDPSRLSNPFDGRDGNFYVRIHEELIRKVLREALEAGVLTELAKEEHEDAVIEGLDVEFGEREIRLVLKGKVVDACPFNKDLGFTVTRSIEFDVAGATAILRQETDVSADSSDLIVCAVSTLGLGFFTALSFGLFAGWLGAGALASSIAGVAAGLVAIIGTEFSEITADALIDLLNEGGGPDVSLFALRDPIPGTELLPQAELISILPGEGTLETFARVSLVPDTISTYIYASFFRRTGLRGAQLEPLANARVELLDQDAPRLAGVGETDAAGLLRIRLRPGDRQTSAEPRPDVYFRVRLPDGRMVDTLTHESGMTLNVGAGRLGTPDAPLTFAFGRGGQVIRRFVEPGR